MGEVYRAKDTKLEREVAIKVLPLRSLRMPTAWPAHHAAATGVFHDLRRRDAGGLVPGDTTPGARAVLSPQVFSDSAQSSLTRYHRLD